MRYFYYESRKYKTELTDDELWNVVLSTRNNNKSTALVLFCELSNLTILRLIFEYSNFQTARFLYEPIYCGVGREEMRVASIYKTRQNSFKEFVTWQSLYDDLKAARNNNTLDKISYDMLCPRPIMIIKGSKKMLKVFSTSNLLKQLEYKTYLKIVDLEEITDLTRLNCIHAALLYEKKLQKKLKVL